MRNETLELKACPFCGGDNVTVSGPYGWYRQWCITHSCGTFYGGAQELAQGFPSEAEAMAAWNTRTPNPALLSEEMIQEARFLCERLRGLESELHDDEVAAEFYGHVAPSIARLEAILNTITGASHGE